MCLIPLVEKGSATAEQAELLRKAPPLNLFKALLHAPGLTTHIAQLGGSLLYKTKLDARVREAAILRVAHVTSCQYEIFHHEKIAREVGLADLELEALASGDLDALNLPLALAAKWAGQAWRDGQASADLVAAAIEAFGLEETVELAVTVGYYTMLSQLLSSFQVPIEGKQAIVRMAERPAALDDVK